MARIFISHSSHDMVAAVIIRDFLVAEGWDDLFLDLDPNRGIVPVGRTTACRRGGRVILRP